MANDLSSRQWRLDTASPGTVIWRGNVYVKQIEWSNYAAAAVLVLKDANGKIVWSATAASDLSPVRLGDIGWINGLIVDTITNGVCVLYTK